MFHDKRMALLRRKKGLTAAGEGVDRKPTRAAGGGLKQFFWPTTDLPVPDGVGIVYPSKLIVATLLAFSVIVALTTVLMCSRSSIEAAMMEVAQAVNYVVSSAEMSSSFPAISDLAGNTCRGVYYFQDAPDVDVEEEDMARGCVPPPP